MDIETYEKIRDRIRQEILNGLTIEATITDAERYPDVQVTLHFGDREIAVASVPCSQIVSQGRGVQE